MPKVIKSNDSQFKRKDEANNVDIGDEGVEELSLSETGFDRMTAGYMRLAGGGSRRMSPSGCGPDADEYGYDNY
ncbi:hypothetical protein [Burkholderia cenocepacia]|uniref:hypothetical protein n=1 Tax=Burkholderia cenocepacia TaxID=95486 RepID=UPI0007614E9A|nr:hypothetical protein [Burkholderia cenocepacia]KWU17789.1 hypothetical protein AS149_13800 [Burkholderia cenocepacia]